MKSCSQVSQQLAAGKTRPGAGSKYAILGGILDICLPEILV